VLIWLGVRKVDLAEVWDAVRASTWGWLLPALALLAVANAIRSLRWQMLFAAPGRPGLAPVTRALLVGLFFNSVLPLRAGEAARLLSLHRHTRVSRTEIAATVVIERIYDVAGLFVLLFIVLPWLPDVAWLATAAWVALALAVAIAFVVALLVTRGAATARLVLMPLRLFGISTERRERATAGLVRGLAGFRDLRTGLVVASLTLVSWAVLALCSWLVTFAFDLDVPFDAGVLVLVATGLAMIVPAPPAALGVFEAAAVAALGAYGFSVEEALPYALVFHALNVLPYLAAGVVLLPGETRLGQKLGSLP
jgi:uncharacterized protein (TIRG00374 family)